MVDLLRRDVVDGCASRNSHNIRSIAGLVAPDVAYSRVFDALFSVCILGLTSSKPVFFFSFAIDNEARKCVCNPFSMLQRLVETKRTMCLSHSRGENYSREELHSVLFLDRKSTTEVRRSCTAEALYAMPRDLL